MKYPIFFLLLFAMLPSVRGEEYVKREVSGERDQHVAVTHFFFDGNQCYGARREYSNLQMHVVRPRIYWDLYYDGELMVTVDPDSRSVDYVRAPEGAVLTKRLSLFSLTRGGIFLRVWDLQANQLSILPEEKLARLTEKHDIANPEFNKLLERFSPRFDAPTLEEAELKMKKVNKPE